MPLDDNTRALLDSVLDSPNGVRAAIFARCWSNSAWSDRARFQIEAGETVDQAAQRLQLGWNPAWLVDAGHVILDAAGAALSEGGAATVSGSIEWSPRILLPRLDDQVGDDKAPSSVDGGKRLTGEVAVAAMWRSTALKNGIADDARDLGLGGQVRGARFKNALQYFLERRLPEAWRVPTELQLKEIHGLHLRRDVPDRQADIAVLDDGPRVLCMISSKWTWRSDRGTEAAQMVPLARYRPDIPYILVTNEFPRLRTIVRESVEDRTYHVAPAWAGAWFETYRLLEGGDVPRLTWPRLQDVIDAGSMIADSWSLGDISNLAFDLRGSGRIA